MAKLKLIRRRECTNPTAVGSGGLVVANSLLALRFGQPLSRSNDEKSSDVMGFNDPPSKGFRASPGCRAVNCQPMISSKIPLAGRLANADKPLLSSGENRRIRNRIFQICMPLLLVLFEIVNPPVGFSATAVPTASRPRILVCTDIGGTDFDDFQSMVHLLVYADRFGIEGIVSSPTGGPGRKADILKVINCYAQDYHNLKTYSDKYPTPDALRAICKQGALHSPGLLGYGKPTEGSKWIIKCAKRPDPRPLWILDWAGIDDVAQALHDDPAIESKIRVYFIGGPNKKWSVPAYLYIMRHFPKLWIIENNSTYRGWFVGGDQRDGWSNAGFVAKYVAGRGALGNFFAGLTLHGRTCNYIKMGDTPSVAYMLGNDPKNPAKNKSWGGQFVRAWDRPCKLFDHAETNPPTAADKVQAFGVVEIRYHLKTPHSSNAEAALVVDRQRFTGFVDKAGVWDFLFSPKTAKSWKYKIESTVPDLNGRTGAFTSYWPSPDLAANPSAKYPNWWTDNPDPALADREGWQGARTISKYRVKFLRDFAARMERCNTPADKYDKYNSNP